MKAPKSTGRIAAKVSQGVKDYKKPVPEAITNIWKLAEKPSDRTIISDLKGLNRQTIADALNLGIATEATIEILNEFFLNADQYREEYQLTHKQAS